MNSLKMPRPSDHIRQRTREWFRKAEHDLVELLNDCMSIHRDQDFEVLREDCQDLTRYRVEFVYPGPIPEQISVAEARAAIQQARRIYEAVKRKAKALGYSE